MGAYGVDGSYLYLNSSGKAGLSCSGWSYMVIEMVDDSGAKLMLSASGSSGAATMMDWGRAWWGELSLFSETDSTKVSATLGAVPAPPVTL